MPAAKYLALIAGVKSQVTATITGGTAGQDGAIVCLDAGGRLDASVLPVGIGADVVATTAGEALAAGDFVYITSSGTAMKAGAGVAGREAVGFVLASAANSAAVTVYLEGRNTALSGLTAGTRYYLSETAGGVTPTPVAGAGKKHQFVGVALSATSINTEMDDYYILA